MFETLAMAGAPIIGGALQFPAAGKASGAQDAATKAALSENGRQFALSRSDNRPFLETGQGANIKLRQLLGIGGAGSVDENDPRFKEFYDPLVQQFNDAHQARFGGLSIYDPRADAVSRDETLGRLRDQAKQQYLAKYGDNTSAPGAGSLLKDFAPGDLVNEPGYQFGLSEGNKAIENAARSRGMYMAPSTVKELLRYGQDYAGTKYNDAFNRDLTSRTTKFNILSGASGGGQVAANTLTGSGAGYTGNIGNLITSGANARGAASIAGANAWGNAFNTISNNYLQNSYLNRILGAGRTQPTAFDNMPAGYGLQ